MVRREGAAERRSTYRAPVPGGLPRGGLAVGRGAVGVGGDGGGAVGRGIGGGGVKGGVTGGVEVGGGVAVGGVASVGGGAIVSSPSVDIIRVGRERARTWPWRGDTTVAFLAPVPEAPILSAAFLNRCMTILGERGFARIVTSALSPMEQTGFFAAGFEVAEELHLLSLELDGLPPPPTVRVTRVTAAGRLQVLAIDRVAFSPFWQLDEHGLDEALGATPRTRFRGVRAADRDGHRGEGSHLIGYAIHGRSGSRGFVQRLAVAPEARRQGIGRDLLVDGLYWMRRRGVRRAVVNTQVGNDPALTLYHDVGFRREPSGLSVMEAGLR